MKCLLILALVATVAYASVGFSNCTSNLLNGYVPHQPTGAVQVCREGAIAISYDTVMINPAWSAYYITAQECDQTITGRLSFYQDPDLKALGVTQASVDSEVFSDAWNRGHVAPSQIMSYSKVAKKAAYTMANIAPQAGTFNQQPWNRLEGYVYNFIKTKRRNLYMVTGVAYKNRANPIRNYTIAVPDYYWKVLCDADNGISAGFYGKNVASGTANTFYTVQAVEALYGGQIFPASTCNTGSVDPSKWWSFSDPLPGDELYKGAQRPHHHGFRGRFPF